MASLKALKIRINSVKSTQKITKAMKMVAAAKLRRAQDAAQNGRPYAERLETVMAGMAARVGGVGASPLLAGTGKDDVQLLVVATSERGLAGAFNTNIVRAARRKAEELTAQGKTVKFYIAGKKGRVLKRFFPNAILADHDMSAIKAPKFDDARVIADDLIARFERGEFDVAHLFYSKFVSALVQDPVAQQLIPVPMPAATKAETSVEAVAEFEPSEEDILDALLPRNVAVQIFRALLENQAGFYGSQMNAMDNATRNAGDMIRRLSIQYNRTRQAAITTELVEIISGAEAL
ncbi:F-type H+-transporting ATPase subunit gamma [Sphingomonas sp. SORGH_AS 950]|uniref:F0F1 ATP synthase subunit gamma n=1 Tax=unclassified Sphingomonas TaxID=196159 RepID=UPI0021BB6711|nr:MULTISPECIES: F0F1 ATP synthase subunit gamma [unclassified Sphingomonas]MCT8002491.1 F0F1 ATP synthase subunit gamma [Sphingomonas sp. LC-1]MDQ1157074.1 F-type H+-transporting ATPase subunit gamma [Sphingomonas sp. SORGH_AS_0950]MDR6115035.1 F-type H+-transporting ATPase subunit gamma [Sphingomonas sp. SORGH_AS_0789]MDR6151291.1 F-type H+-transporting ATPase subunit gamma [Sphingomonas sp. SORGH_AS_0742]